MANPIDLSNQRQLFVDDLLIDKLDGAQIHQHSPIPRETSLTLNKPWEGETSWCPVVIQDDNKYRMWYRSQDAQQDDNRFNHSFTAYAESEDGIHWERPRLGLVEFDGSTDNNICIDNPNTKNVAVFKDERPGVPESERYKAAGRWSGGKPARIYGLVSPDGIHWKNATDGPLIIASADDPHFDSPVSAFWDERQECYVLYARGWFPEAESSFLYKSLKNVRVTPQRTPQPRPKRGFGRQPKIPQPKIPRRYLLSRLQNRPRQSQRKRPQMYEVSADPPIRMRAIRMTTSKDFIHWEPWRYISIDGTTVPEHELYTNAVHPYERAPYYLSFPKRFVANRKFLPEWDHDGLSDVLFLASRDGLNFSQPYHDAYLRPGFDINNWHDRSIFIGPRVVSTAPGELSFYSVQNYRTDNVHIQRFTLREDGFTSVRANRNVGTLTTKPFTFAGSQLEINYATSVAGSVRVAVLDESGSPISGYHLNDCSHIFGDEISRIVRWEQTDKVNNDQPIRLQFELKEADLYSFCWV